MTPENHLTGEQVLEGCAAVALVSLILWLILTPLVMIVWNVGLEPAGIAKDTISWGTAAGLTLGLNVLRLAFR